MTWDLALVVAGHSLSFAGFAVLFLLVAISRRASPHRNSVLVAAAGTALWAAGTIGAAAATGQPAIVPFLEWPRLAGWLWLILTLLSTAAPQRARAYKRLALLGIGVPLAALTALTLVDAFGADAFGVEASIHRLVHSAEAIALVSMIVFGLALLETLARWMSAGGRKAAMYLFLGVGSLLAIDLFLYATILLLGRVELPIYQARGFISCFAAPLIAIALARQRDWLIDLHLSRQVIVNAATLMGVGIYLLAMALAGFAVRELDAAWGPALHITFLAGALLLLASILASDGFRPRLNALVSRHFYSAKYDYRQEWLRFSNALAAEASRSPLEERLLSAILESVGCRSGCLWLQLADDRGFVIAAAKPSSLLFSEEPCGAVAALMSEQHGAVSISASATGSSALVELGRYGPMRNPWAAIPIRHRGRMVAFLVLAEPPAPRPLDAEDQEFLQTLAVQAGAHLTEERAAVSLDRTRRFEASARQLTYIGHDLKNIVSQLSMVLQNWARHKTNETFLAELPVVLDTAVQRMKGLLEGLKGDRTANSSINEAIEVNQCLAGLIPLWRARYSRLTIELDPIHAVVRGQRDRLQSIFDQLVCNAIEASDGVGAIRLYTRLEGNELVARISDHGTGISEQTVVGSRLTANESRKPGGFGVGLFQVRDYVREFGGNLSFSSDPGSGTTATLRIPVLTVSDSNAGASATNTKIHLARVDKDELVGHK